MNFRLMISCLLLLVSLKVNTAATNETDSSSSQLSTIARLGTEFNNASNDAEKLKISVQILGIDFNTTGKEITKAYRHLSLKLHPDKNMERQELADKAFKGLGLAYDFMELFKSYNKSAQESILRQADTALQNVGKRARQEEDDDEEVRRMRAERRARQWGHPDASSSSSAPIAFGEQVIQDVMRKAFERNKRFHFDDKEEAVEYLTIYKGFEKASIEANLSKVYSQYYKWFWLFNGLWIRPAKWEGIDYFLTVKDFLDTKAMDKIVYEMKDYDYDRIDLRRLCISSLDGIEDIPDIDKVERLVLSSEVKFSIDHLPKLKALKSIEIKGDSKLLYFKEEFEAKGIKIQKYYDEDQDEDEE